MKTLLAFLVLAAALAFPVAASAQGQEPIPPPNPYACNGLIVAYGDHPAGAPAFFAQYVGLPVAQAIQFARSDSDCAPIGPA